MAHKQPKEMQKQFLVTQLGYSSEAADAFIVIAGSGMVPVSLQDWYDHAVSWAVAPMLLANIAHSLGAAHVGCSNEVIHWKLVQDRLQLYHELETRGVCLTPRADMLPEWR